jgi:hypothetical protein
MPRYAITGFSGTTPWSDEADRERFAEMLSQHGELRFLGIEDGRATFKMLLEATDRSDAEHRRDDALRATFGSGHGFSGPDVPAVAEIDPFPDHPADERLRIQAAGTEARELGYTIDATEAPNMPPEQSYMAYVAPYVVGQPSMGWWVCYALTRADAAERALEIIRGHVERDEPWPDDG